MMCQSKLMSVILVLFLSVGTVSAQVAKFGFDEVLKNQSEKLIPLAIPNNEKNLKTIKNSGVKIKYTSKNWIHIIGSPSWVAEMAESRQITDFYFEYAPPVQLDDTSRATHFVDEVLDGQFPLSKPYSGKGIIVGIVDSGMDHNHPDFIDSTGKKRLIRYWDHTISNPSQTLDDYGYGQIWYEDDITSGVITSSEPSGSSHGTNVAGICVGNGRANGLNKGMAPEASIVVVRSNFSLPNWTLTIADACDYIFKLADSLDMPAVVNLSLGSYMGSHDAKDPAGEHIDELLNKDGRIVVCAAGNSGNSPGYHVRNEIDADTSFVWFQNNSNGALGPNTVFFEMWSDVDQADFDFAIGVNKSSGDYNLRARTDFRYAVSGLGGLTADTLYNEFGDRLCTIQIFRQLYAENYQLQVLISNIDSTTYYYGFYTTGNGSYDLWSGTFLNLNTIVENVPAPDFYPPIVNYAYPDFYQSIVSSWNCSEKVISVGNIRGRLGHIDKNGDQYYPNEMTTPGKIALSSSRGPTRKGIVKPDVVATGDVTLGAAPAWMMNNHANNPRLDQGGFHSRNGGTSMASPVVAGVAALYLEQCDRGNWQSFKEDLLASVFTDEFTGTVPNFEYGYGKLNAFELMQINDGSITIFGDTIICQNSVTIGTAQTIDDYLWSDGSNSSLFETSTPQDVSLIGWTERGCKWFSDTLIVTAGIVPSTPEIIFNEGVLVATEGENYQWYYNDVAINGANSQTYTPEESGFYSVSVTSEDGCKSFSNAFNATLSIKEVDKDFSVSIFPNPSKGDVTISSENGMISNLIIYDQLGQIVFKSQNSGKKLLIPTSNFAVGLYLIKFEVGDTNMQRKFIKH